MKTPKGVILSVTLSLVLGLPTSVLANYENGGGYYESLSKPQMNADSDAKFKPGEGLYGDDRNQVTPVVPASIPAPAATTPAAAPSAPGALSTDGGAVLSVPESAIQPVAPASTVSGVMEKPEIALPVVAKTTPETYEKAMSEGVNFYVQHAFRGAQESFEEACKLKPSEPEAYYWLGKTCEQLRDHEGAKDAFNAAFRLQPFGNYGQKAKQAMLDASAEATAVQHKPFDTPEDVQACIGSINRQVDSSMMQKLRDAQTAARWELELGRLTVNRITRQSRDEIASMRSNGYTGYNGRYSGRTAVIGFGRIGYGASLFNGSNYNGYGNNNSSYNGQVQEVSNWRNIKTSYARSDASAQSARALADGALRARNLQDFANDLVNDLAQPYVPGKVHLRAQGTCLYVQNYESDDSASTPLAEPALHAVPGTYQSSK